MKRGEVVIIDFPFVTGGSSKTRPALVVQNDRDNQRIRNTIVAMITGNLRRSGEPTHLLIDPATSEGVQSGLKVPSLINCSVLYTIEQQDIIATIGSIPSAAMQRVNQCLKAALELP